MTNLSTKSSINIDHIRIATPCPIRWEQMSGDHRIRFCGHCQLNVYNISELSRIEAESLIASAEGRICARLYRRVDGTILTKDCPVGLRALRMRVSKRAAAVFAAIASICSASAGQQSGGKTSGTQQTRITSTIGSTDTEAKALSGTVLDPLGAAIAWARVTVKDRKKKEIASVSVTDAGRFEFASLAAGDYSVTIEAAGFKTLNLTKVIVEKDKLTNIDTFLEISGGYLTGDIPVTKPVDTTPPGTTIISGDLIRRLPIQ